MHKIWRFPLRPVFHFPFPEAKTSAVCAEFPMGSKFHFSKWKTYLSQFIDKFLKFEEKFEMCPSDLFKFVILFPNVTLKLGHNFPKLIYRLKIGAFECWSWAVLAVLIPIHNKIWNWDFWMLLQLDFSHFPNSLKRLTIGILNISLGCTSKFFPIP